MQRNTNKRIEIHSWRVGLLLGVNKLKKNWESDNLSGNNEWWWFRVFSSLKNRFHNHYQLFHCIGSVFSVMGENSCLQAIKCSLNRNMKIALRIQRFLCKCLLLRTIQRRNLQESENLLNLISLSVKIFDEERKQLLSQLQDLL